MVDLFFSYSHNDEDLRIELEKHLTILRRNHIINSWHDRRIEAGQDLGHEINIHLKNANIILLLISPDFLASDYCYELEMTQAMRMHDAGTAIVIPVILRPCYWHDTPFGKLLAIPTDGKAVTQFANRDEAFLNITQAIKRSLQQTSSPFIANKPILSQIPGQQASFRNLAIPKKFTDREKDIFIEEAFAYMASYFEASAAELMKQNSHVESKFQKIDPKRFSIEVYVQGARKAQSMIFIGGMDSSSKAISFSYQIHQHNNSLNDSLTIADDGFSLSLKPLGMQMFGSSQPQGNLSVEAAAEYYWSLTIKALQRNN